MKSVTTAQFWEFYVALPPEIQRRADRTYQIWRSNPNVKGLFFKRVKTKQPIYSVRVGRSHRALGILEKDTILWFWIGAHDEYERLLKQL